MIPGTLFQDFILILPYFKIILVYFVLVQMFKNGLRGFIINSRTYNLLQYGKKIKKTVRAIGVFLLIVFTILYSTESAVGKAFVYNLVEYILYIVGIIILFISSFAWRLEIGKIFGNDSKNE